jgi:hypothetical protein
VIADVAGYFPAGSDLVAVESPTRLLDTRFGIGWNAPASNGQPIALQVAGNAAVPADASAVFINVTATNTLGAGFLTVWPCGQAQPTASNLNFGRRTTVANLVVAGIGAAGQVCMATNTTTDVVADVSGYFPAGSNFEPLVAPLRLVDTRIGLGGPTAQRLPASSRFVMSVPPTAGVPSDATGLVLNVTAVDTAAPGFLTVWPCSSPQPTASNLNYETGDIIANLAIAANDPQGVCFFAHASLDLVVDLAGYFKAGGVAYSPLPSPQRILDTRREDGCGLVLRRLFHQLIVTTWAGAPVADFDGGVGTLTGQFSASCDGVYVDDSSSSPTTIKLFGLDGSVKQSIPQVSPNQGFAVLPDGTVVYVDDNTNSIKAYGSNAVVFDPPSATESPIPDVSGRFFLTYDTPARQTLKVYNLSGNLVGEVNAAAFGFGSFAARGAAVSADGRLVAVTGDRSVPGTVESEKLYVFSFVDRTVTPTVGLNSIQQPRWLGNFVGTTPDLASSPPVFQHYQLFNPLTGEKKDIPGFIYGGVPG